MSDGGLLPSDVAADWQTFEDLLRELTRDQWPNFSPIVRHIRPHFVKQSLEERRQILTWLRGAIMSRSRILEPIPTSFAALSSKDRKEAETRRLLNINREFLAIAAEINNAPWLNLSEDDYPTNHPIAHLDRYIKFMAIWREVIDMEGIKVRHLDLISSDVSSGEDQNDLISEESRLVLNIYGFGIGHKPKANDAIQRIQDAYLAFSITEKARAVLNPDEHKDYEAVLRECMKIVDHCDYFLDQEVGVCSDILKRLTVIAEPHQQLMQLVMEVPWYHLQECDPPKTDEPDWSTWDEN